MTQPPDASSPPPPPRRYRLSGAKRLHGREAFAHVYAGKMRKHAGPVSLATRPNDLPHCRLGLSVSRRVGNAVVRNRIKRLLREAFRLSQHDWPAGYDVIIMVRPHDTLMLADYQRCLAKAMRASHLEWDKRRRRVQTQEQMGEPSAAGDET